MTMPCNVQRWGIRTVLQWIALFIFVLFLLLLSRNNFQKSSKSSVISYWIPLIEFGWMPHISHFFSHYFFFQNDKNVKKNETFSQKDTVILPKTCLIVLEQCVCILSRYLYTDAHITATLLYRLVKIYLNKWFHIQPHQWDLSFYLLFVFWPNRIFYTSTGGNQSVLAVTISHRAWNHNRQ